MKGTLTNNLKMIMADRSINSITDLMQITGLSRNAINSLLDEEEIETVKLSTLFKVCNAFKLPLSELINYQKEVKPMNGHKEKIQAWLERLETLTINEKDPEQVRKNIETMMQLLGYLSEPIPAPDYFGH